VEPLDQGICLPVAGFALSMRQRVLFSVLLAMSFLVTYNTKSYQILGRVIAEVAPRPNLMDLKIFCSPAELATPAVPLQNFTAELAISVILGFRHDRWDRIPIKEIPGHSREVDLATASEGSVPAETEGAFESDQKYSIGPPGR
jgi:hypothetical protein